MTVTFGCDSMYEAMVLRHAVAILRKRSRKPRTFVMDVLCKVIENFADNIEKGTR